MLKVSPSLRTHEGVNNTAKNEEEICPRKALSKYKGRVTRDNCGMRGNDSSWSVSFS